MTSETFKECVQQDVAAINIQSGSSPKPQIASPPSPPFEVSAFHLDSSLPTTIVHNHSCNYCGTAFACELQCKSATEQYCEYCEVWGMRYGRSTNKQKLADYLDDQVVIEEVKQLANQNISRSHCIGATDSNKKGGK